MDIIGVDLFWQGTGGVRYIRGEWGWGLVRFAFGICYSDVCFLFSRDRAVNVHDIILMVDTIYLKHNM